MFHVKHALVSINTKSLWVDRCNKITKTKNMLVSRRKTGNNVEFRKVCLLGLLLKERCNDGENNDNS